MRKSKKSAPETPAVNNQAFLSGGAMAIPAPSAQPSKNAKPTERRARVSVNWIEDEDEAIEWRRAGGADPNEKRT